MSFEYDEDVDICPWCEQELQVCTCELDDYPDLDAETK